MSYIPYDGDGKRAKRVDSYGAVHYVGPHYERNVGNGQSTAEVVIKYYYAQLGPYKRLIAMRQNGTLYYVHTEHLGGTNILSDTGGNEVGAIRYHGYGQTRVQTGTIPTDKKFTGQTLDNSTGLYYYGARYYDGALGRFVQPDSIVPQPGNPQSLNRYSYGYNNPVKYVDPSGHDPQDWINDDWKAEFRANHGGAESTSIDYAYRIVSMAQATGMASGYRVGPWADSGGIDPSGIADLLGDIGGAIGQGAQSVWDIFRKNIGTGLARSTNDTIGHIKASPGTLVGLIYGIMEGGTAKIDPNTGTITFTNMSSLPFDTAYAVTFGDAILTKDRALDVPTLQHELVHVAQYRALSAAGFVAAYGIGMIPGQIFSGHTGGRANPMEAIAYWVGRLAR